MDFSVLQKCLEYFRDENHLEEAQLRELVASAISDNRKLGYNVETRYQCIHPKYEHIDGIDPPLDFTRQTLGNLKGGASFRHVVALILLCATESDFADSLRQIETHPCLYGATIWEIYREYETKAKLELGLVLRPNLRSAEQPHSPQDAILHYGYDRPDKIEVLGRENEQEELRAFLRDERMFLWVQLAGSAGQGKSRLAWDLILEERSKKETGFDAGYMRGEDLKEFVEGWAHWNPHKPTLIVIDYVHELDKTLGVPMAILASRNAELSHPVRFLLLERQRWNCSSIRSVKHTGQSPHHRNVPHHRIDRISASEEEFDISAGNSGWFERLEEERRTFSRLERDFSHLEETPLASANHYYGTDGVIELKALKPRQLSHVTKQVAQRENPKQTIQRSDSEIESALNRFDGSGRPLYAYFLGLVMADGHFPSDWKHTSFLDQVLTIYQRKQWSSRLNGSPLELADNNSGLYLAVCATVLRAIPKGILKSWPLGTLETKRDYRTALAVVSAPVGEGIGGTGSIIPGMLPDLLGEWFVLRFFEAQPQLIDKLLSWCWCTDPNATANFLLRIAEDFPTEHITSMLLRVPCANSTNEGRRAIEEHAPSIITALFNSKHPPPKIIMEHLENSAQNGRVSAIETIALCYWHGYFFEKDTQEAMNWWSRAADQGHVPALLSLAACFHHGTGSTEPDKLRSIHLLFDAASYGNYNATQIIRGSVWWNIPKLEPNDVNANLGFGLKTRAHIPHPVWDELRHRQHLVNQKDHSLKKDMKKRDPEISVPRFSILDILSKYSTNDMVNFFEHAFLCCRKNRKIFLEVADLAWNAVAHLTSESDGDGAMRITQMFEESLEYRNTPDVREKLAMCLFAIAFLPGETLGKPALGDAYLKKFNALVSEHRDHSIIERFGLDVNDLPFEIPLGSVVRGQID